MITMMKLLFTEGALGTIFTHILKTMDLCLLADMNHFQKSVPEEFM